MEKKKKHSGQRKKDEPKGKIELRKQQSEDSVEQFLKILPFAVYTVMIPLYKYQIEYVWSKIAWGYIGMALFGITITFVYLRRRKIFFNIPKTFPFVVALIVYGVLSALWAINPYKTHNLAVMIGPGILAYLASQTLTIREIKVIPIFMAIASSIVSGYGILQLVGVYPMPADQYGNPNPITTFGLSNFAVEYLLLPFGLIIWLAISERGPLKVVYIISAILNFAYIFGCKNRAGWVGMTVILFGSALVYLLWRYGENPKKVLAYFSSGLVVFLVIFAIFVSFTDYGKGVLNRLKSFVQVGPGSSVTTRLMAWDASYEMMKDNPLFGVGAGNYEILSWKYAPRLLDELTMQTNTRVDKAHNEYIQIMADLGIVGFTLFFSIILIIFSLYLDVFRKRKEKSDNFFLASGLIFGIVGLLSSASFNFSLQWPGSVTHFWLFVGFLEVVRAETEEIKPFEFIPQNKFLYFIPGIFFIASSLGPPCKNGIPFCREGICLERKLCRSMPGFFTARNFALAEVYYRLGQFYKRARRFDISERFYLASLKHENPAERTYYDMAYLYIAKNGGRLDQRVLNLLESTLKLVPYFGKGRRELGKMYIQIGQVDKGIEYVLRSTDANPANIPEAYSIVANAYVMKKDYDKAIEYAERALEELNNSPLKSRYGVQKLSTVIFDEDEVRFLAYFVLGTAYAGKKDYNNAEKYLKMADSIKPGNPRVIINLATTYINQGKFDEAENLLNSFEPKNDAEKVARLFNLASLYAAKGEKQKAIEYLNAASYVNPDIIRQAFQDIHLKKILLEK